MNIDNRRSETVLKAQSYSALKSVLIDDANVSAKSAQETFDRLFPKDAQGRNTVPLGSELEVSLSSALQSQIIAKQQAESARKLNTFTDALKADPSHFNIVKQFLNTQGSPSWTSNEQDTAKFTLSQTAFTSTATELETVQTREALKIISDRADAYLQAGIFTQDQYGTFKQRKLAKEQDVEQRFLVQDVINRIPGWQQINLGKDADKWINRNVTELMQPTLDRTGKPIEGSGMSLDRAYSYMVETFGRLTPEWITNLDDLTNSPGVGTGDPNQDYRTKYQRLSDAAAIFGSFKATAPGYINQLISEKKITGKMQALAGAVDILGERPDNVALYLASVPKDAYIDAEGHYTKPPKGMSDAVTTLKDSFGDGWFTLAPDSEGMSGQLLEDYKSLFLYNYGLLWTQSNGGANSIDLSIAASKAAADQMKKPTVAYMQNFGNFKNVVQPRVLPTNMEPSSVELMSKVWDQVLTQAEGSGLNINNQGISSPAGSGFENIRYGTTNINTDYFKVSQDGKYYEFDAYQTDRPGGKLMPVAKFLWPINEVEQKKLAERIDAATYQEPFDILDSLDVLFNGPRVDTIKMNSSRNEVYKELWVPYGVKK